MFSCILSASTKPCRNKCTYLIKFDSRVFYVLSRRTPLEIPTHWSELTISVPNKTTKVKFLNALITWSISLAISISLALYLLFWKVFSTVFNLYKNTSELTQQDDRKIKEDNKKFLCDKRDRVIICVFCRGFHLLCSLMGQFNKFGKCNLQVQLLWSGYTCKRSG